ncbi:TonB-dependent receptor [Duganella sp. LX20W]|uniref:TonB-dependent receptor n=1 Tax=Rugamonas brunnea TaxID=2758569 RepID=A0A7W2EP28_9BURK|nr:TonB-dependent receptor [Rugamonas brunnea]MBA5636003.1 TonB-dependent receptor [Rugamonas brunnea]
MQNREPWAAARSPSSAARARPLALAIWRALLGGAFAAGALLDPAIAAGATEAAQSQPATPAGQGEDAAIGIVTITAQSRTQAAQAVPIAMQLISSDQIGKLAAVNLSAMNGYIPGLAVDAEQPTQPKYAMRGIGTSDFGIGTDSPVGVYVDGVYTGKTGGALMNFNDTQRVEVLKGPQGTLFGRNSAGGAISVITREPSQERAGEVHLRAGNHGLAYMDGLLNVPLSDTMALRMTVVDQYSKGWLRDAATGEHLNGNSDWGTRATLRWNAPEQTKVLLSWEHEKLDQKARPAIGLVALPAAPGVPTVPVNPQAYLDPRTAPVYNDAIGNAEARDFDGVTLRVERPFGWGTFNSTTAYRHFKSRNLEDSDGTNRINTHLDTINYESNGSWQQEFKLSGKTALVDWVGGASFYYENAHQTSQIGMNTDTLDTVFGNLAGMPVYTLLDGAAQQFGVPAKFFGNSWQESMINRGQSKAYALFADTIWHVAPKTNLTAGVRLTHDDKRFSWYSPNRDAPGLDATLAALNAQGFFPGLVQAGALTPDQLQQVMGALTQNIEFNNPSAATAAVSAHKGWTDVSPRVVLDYKLTPAVMVYGSVTKGYQAGGFNALAVAGKYEPETIWNYEAGVKSYFREQHLLINASLFHYKFSNLQSLSLIGNTGSAIPTYQVSSSNQVATGLDAEARWQATRDLRLTFSSEYINQKYQHFVTGDGVDLSDQPVGAPLWSASAGIDYTWRDAFGGTVNVSAQHAYTGATRCNADALQGACLRTPAFTVGGARQHSDLRLGWEADSGNWGVALFVNNVFDKRYVNRIDNTSAGIMGTPFATVSEPRRIGVELRASL